MKRGTTILLLFLLVSSFALAEEDIYSDINNAELREGAGLTPDNFLYFFETFIEDFTAGDDPEAALKIKEEKIAEVRQMVAEGKIEEAKEALRRAKKYGDILKNEVSPDIERRTRESSKAIRDVLKN